MGELARHREGLLLVALLLLPATLRGETPSSVGVGLDPVDRACVARSAIEVPAEPVEPEDGSEEGENESGPPADPPPGGWAPVRVGPSGNPYDFLDALEDQLLSPTVAPRTPGTDTSLCMSWEMSAASDPNNRRRLAVIQGSTLGVSTDGGDNFTFVSVGASLPAGFTSSGDGTAAYDRSGRLFVAILGNPTAPGGWQVFVSRHDPVTGALVSGPVSVSAAVGITPSATSDKPWIAADAHPGSSFANRLYVVWSVTGGSLSGDFEVWGAVSTNQGANWTQMTRGGLAYGPISPIDASDGKCWPAHVAVGRVGDVYVAYHGQPGFLIDPDGVGGPPDGISGKVVLLRSVDGGATFPQRSEPFPAGQGDTTWNSQGNATGAIPDARFWTIGTGAGYILPDPNLNCRLHVVTDDDPDNDPTSGDAADVRMATSTDCGVTWATRQTVNDGLAGTWQLLPAAAIDAQTGAIAVTWLDNRNASSYPPGSAGNARVDLRVRYSLNGGVSWLPSLIVNDLPIDPDASTSTIGSGIPPTYRIGEYHGVTFAECAAHMVWPGQATCNGAMDTYYDRDPQVADLDPPDITCPDDEALSCLESTDPANTGSATARDDCDGDPPLIYVDQDLGGSCPPTPVIASFNRTWSSTDAAGNIASCVQHISVEDFDAPVIHVPQPLVLECPAQGGAPASDPQIQGWIAEGEAVDTCSASQLQVSGVPLLFPASCAGVPTWVTFAAADVCGNSDFEQSSVTVADTTPPSLLPPTAHTFECTEPGGTPSDNPAVAAWLASPATLDVCSAPVLTNDAPDLLPADCVPGVATPVFFTSTDGCGNASHITGLAVVVDSRGPDIVDPPGLEVLFPPDHDYVCFDNVAGAAQLEDACGSAVTDTAIACTSSQCDDAPCAEHPGEDGDGNSINDCVYDAALDQLCTRAERAQTDPAGRLYTVTLTATDACGNDNAEPILLLFVPHGCGEGDAACVFLDGFESGTSLAWTVAAHSPEASPAGRRSPGLERIVSPPGIVADSFARMSAAPAQATAASLLARLGRALHEAGTSAPQLESALTRVASRLGVSAQFFSTPTSLFISIGAGGADNTSLERVDPSGIDLGRLAELETLIDRVAAGAISAESALDEIEALRRRPRRYPRLLTGVCWGLASGAAAVFLGGGLGEVAVASAIGLAAGAFSWLAERRPAMERLFEPFVAALAAFTAAGFAHFAPPLSIYITTVAGLIVLLPGYTLTTALSELAARHLSSGTSRFAGALVTFLMIGLGVAVGGRLAETLWGHVSGTIPLSPPLWLQLIALIVSPIALTVHLKAPRSELPWIVAVGAIGYFCGRRGVEAFEPAIGMFFGALAVGLAAAAHARIRKVPASISLVPGTLMLVPGSIGYKSLTSLLAAEVVPGIETAFRMLLVAASLVAGLLLASALTVPGRER